MENRNSNSADWDTLWSDDKKIALAHENDRFLEPVEERIGEFLRGRDYSNLSVINLGSGSGEGARRFASRGAKVTLVDFSKSAIDVSKEKMARYEDRSTFIQGDVFNLPNDLKHRFDISISFGLAEHFDDWQRQRIFNVHVDLLKDDGFCLISVPNAACVPYRISKALSGPFGLWRAGFERPFHRKELLRRAEDAGAGNISVISSGGFIWDIVNWGLKKPLLILSHRKLNIHPIYLNIPTILDDDLCATFYLFCERKQSR